MAAKSKTELVELIQKEFGKLTKLIETLDADIAMKKHEEDTSIKDVIAHRAHWIELFLGWYEDGMAGKKVHFPAPGYKWNELKRYNAELRIAQADLDWQAAVALLQKNHQKLSAFVEVKSNQSLYAAPMKGANNAWTPGRWAEAAGPSHYRSAAKYIRSVRKNAQ